MLLHRNPRLRRAEASSSTHTEPASNSKNDEGDKHILDHPCLSRLSIQDWLHHVYSNPSPAITKEGHLTLHLDERAFGRAGLPFLATNLSKMRNIQVDSMMACLKGMEHAQRSHRNILLQGSIEMCCAAANDFYRMSNECNKAETYALIAQDSENNAMASSQNNNNNNDIREALKSLQLQYASDAVYAVQHLHAHVFRVIEEGIGNELFSLAWEDTTDCEAIAQMVSIMKGFIDELYIAIAEKELVARLIESMLQASINFYIKHLLIKSDEKQEKVLTREAIVVDPWDNGGAMRMPRNDKKHHNLSHPGACFEHVDRATYFIHADIAVLRDFFDDYVKEFPGLKTVIESEFNLMNDIFGLLLLASSDCDVHDGVCNTLLMHVSPILKAVNDNEQMCRFIVNNLFHLVAPEKEHDMNNILTVDCFTKMKMANSYHNLKRLNYGQQCPGTILELEAVVMALSRARNRRAKQRCNRSGRILGLWST